MVVVVVAVVVVLLVVVLVVLACVSPTPILLLCLVDSTRSTSVACFFAIIVFSYRSICLLLCLVRVPPLGNT
jgi:hypothetical protein